jgi:hypothetical protein
LNSLTILSDEETLNSLIRILTSINYQIEDNTVNCFLKVFATHDNSRFFGESLLRILNNEEDKSSLYRILQCIIDIIDHTKSSFFYSTDLESFINIAIKKLESTYTDKLRYYILKVLERITFYDDYYKMRYKLDLLEELMENYQTNEEVEEENQNMATNILENIRKHK